MMLKSEIIKKTTANKHTYINILPYSQQTLASTKRNVKEINKLSNIIVAETEMDFIIYKDSFLLPATS